MPDEDDINRTADAAQTAELRTTAKWLVAASASIATLVVAGLQLKDLGNLRGSLGLALGALLATVAALVAVGLTLYDAAAVLVSPRQTIDELARRERRDNWPNYPAPRAHDPLEPLIVYLTVERRSELLGHNRDTIYDLVQDHRNAHRALRTRQADTIRGTRYDPNDAAQALALQALAEELRGRVQHICDAGGWYETEQRYKTLTKRLWWRGGLFLLGAFAFALLITLPASRAKVTAPVQAEVHVRDAGAAASAGLSPKCAGEVLSAVVVGGTLDKPVVVTRPKGKCTAGLVTETDELVVIPVGTPRK